MFENPEIAIEELPDMESLDWQAIDHRYIRRMLVERGLVVVAAFIAMIINHVFAGLAGIAVPLALKRLGFDPAVSSSVFVTTVTDVIGFLAFLGFAALMLL